MIKFREFAASSIGPKYAAKGWDCQDSSDMISFDDVQAVAVADGHGGGDYFRSQIGSKLAIEVLFNQLRYAFENMKDTERFSDTAIKNFKYNFVKEWRKAVRKDWYDRLSDGKPLGEGEIRYESVSEKYKARYTSDNPDVVEKYLYVAYGTTLICAVSIGTQILAMQIGDGSCVLLQRDGEFSLPIPTEEENFLNMTVSLCDDNSELKIRHAVINCKENSPNSPAAIFLSTDGLDDCFPYYQNEEHLYKFYADVIIDSMVKNLFLATEKEIREQLLPGLTKKASKDDISLAYLILPTVFELKKVFDKIDARYKTMPEPPKKILAAENSSPAQKKVVKAFVPQKISSTTSTTTKTAVSEFKLPPFMDIAPPTPIAQKFSPTSAPPAPKQPPPPPQTLFKANTVFYGAPVPVGGTPQTETFTPSVFKPANLKEG